MELAITRINTFFEVLPDRLRLKRTWTIFFFMLATAFLGFGIKNVVIDESLAAYFRDDDPVKQAYDRFRTVFGGDEYVYVVYRARDKDVFSDTSLKALKGIHDDLADYRLKLGIDETSALDHIDEVKSLINVKYMEAKENTLYSRNFIGNRLPENSREREDLRQKALNHPDYPLIYLSKNSEYGGLVIRTDFNAETAGLSGLTEEDAGSDSRFDDDADPFADETESVAPVPEDVAASEIIQTDMREYPLFMAELRTILDKKEYADALEFYLVGNPVLMEFFAVAVIQDVGRLMSYVLLLIVAMLWMLFRSLAAVVWPVIVVALTIVWILGIIGWAGITMSSMVQVIIFLSLSVGIADAVHILSGYLFFRNEGLDHQEALNAVMKKSGLACLLTSITTAIGLLSLTLVPLKPISTFGLFAAIAVFLAFVFTIVLLPLMLDLWSPVSPKSKEGRDHFVLKGIKKIERVGISRAYLMITLFAIAGAVFFYGLMQLKVDSNFVEIIKEGLPLRDAYGVVDDHMGGTGNMEIMMDFQKEDALKDPDVLIAMETLQEFMEQDKSNKVVKTMSLVNVVKDSYKALNDDDPLKHIIPLNPAVLKQVIFMFENANPKDRSRLVTDDYSRARIGLNSINVGSIEALEIMEKVQGFMDERFESLEHRYPDLEVALTGNMALLAIMLDYLAWAQIKSFGLALLVISIILFVVLGSSKAGLVALAPNLFPILTAFGLMGYFKIPLDADTLLVAPIIIGLAVDDTIHFMTHFRIEMERSRNIAQAAVRSIREAGQAISFTSLILSVGFLVFLLSFHNGLSHFGIFAAIAIMTALISDLFLLPALCQVMNVDFNRRIKG